MNKLKYILFTLLAGAVIVIILPVVIPLTGKNNFPADYRIPYYLGEDYFLFGKYAGSVSDGRTTAVIGDSVIWGHYASDTDTLTAHLNSKSATVKFSNLGIDGIHPAAMYGLAGNFCRKFTGKKIIVGINLLWMSSPRHDLTGAKNSEINHKILLTQFTETIPAYSPSSEEKLSFVIKRNIPFLLWIDHLKLTEFREKSFYRWSMDNPSESICSFFKPQINPYEVPAPMDFRKLPKQKIDWIDPGKSLQWKYTLKTINNLKEKNNRILALITPFNIYMMTDESVKQHALITAEMKKILEKENITVVIPSTPGIDKFADSSHPAGKGYETIAGELLKNSDFIKFINE